MLGRVIDVIRSCKTRAQVKVARRYAEIYIKGLGVIGWNNRHEVNRIERELINQKKKVKHGHPTPVVRE